MQILIAHSSEQQVHHLEKALQHIDLFHIQTATDGFQALDYMVRHHYHICLLEKDLPGLNAKDILKALRFKSLKIKLIILGFEKSPSFNHKRNVLAQIDLSEQASWLSIRSMLKKERKAFKMGHKKAHQYQTCRQKTLQSIMSFRVIK